MKKELPCFVEHEDMDRPMEPAIGMDISAGFLAEDLICLIDDVEEFISFLRVVLERMIVGHAGEFDPLFEGEFLSASRWIEIHYIDGCLPIES